MSEPKLIDFPAEAHEAAELQVMLTGCATEAERKAVREAFYTFAQGDPRTFGVQFAVLLAAHVRALKAAPEALKKAVTGTFSEVNNTVASHRVAVKQAQATLSQEVATVGQQAALANQDLCHLREELSKCSATLQDVFAGVVEERKTIQAATEAILSISERRIIFGLLAAFAAGVVSCGAAMWIWTVLCAS